MADEPSPHDPPEPAAVADIADGEPCRVCAEPTSRYCNATCYTCGSTFHLALREDVPARDCGQVWLNDDVMALEFACNICLGAVPEPAAQADARADLPTSRRYVRRTGVRAGRIVRSRRRS